MNMLQEAKWAEAGIISAGERASPSLDGVKITRAGQHFVIETPLTRRRAEISEATARPQAVPAEAKVPPLTIRTPAASSRLQSKGAAKSESDGGGGNSSSMDVEDGVPQLQVAQKRPAATQAAAAVPKEPPPKRETKSEKRARDPIQ